MDSLGDYIYIIILAIAGLSGLLKKKKKTETSSAPKSTKRSWEDVLRELTPIEPEPEPVIFEPEPAPVAKTIEPQKIISYETVSDPSELRSKKSASHFSPPKKQKKEEIEVIEEKPVLEFSLNSPDDARRAFIYSEIFNRKY